MSAVIDTNVPVIANGRGTHAGLNCVLACIEALSSVRSNGPVLLDDHDLILEEYRGHLSYAGQPGLGDAFFKWLWENQANPNHCRRVPITPVGPPRYFAEFPEDPELDGFDADDRKFVATAVSSGERPRILNASDTDWWQHHTALERNNVLVTFTCPELMEQGR